MLEIQLKGTQEHSCDIERSNQQLHGRSFIKAQRTCCT